MCQDKPERTGGACWRRTNGGLGREAFRCQAEGKNFNGKMTPPALRASGIMMPYGQECELKPSDVREKRKNIAVWTSVRWAFLRALAACLTLVAGVAIVPVQAGDISKDSMLPKEKPGPDVAAILEHFPAGSIDSLKKADQVLEIVRIEKQNINARLYNEKLLCNEKFLVYMCYDEAEERRRIDLQALYMLELEAKRFKRSDEIRQRDLALDRRELKEEADATQRAESLRAHEERVRRVQEREAKREAAARGVTDSPDKRHSGNLMTPAEKAENVREYEAKQEESARRLERVERKRAETQKKRDKKAAEEARDAE